MHVEARSDVCEGHGLCAQTSPANYDLDDDGYVQVKVTDPDPSQEAAASAGARVCPVSALTVTS